jgi:hypothetical protein
MARSGAGTGTGLGMNAEWIGVQRKSRKREVAYSCSGFATLDELRSHYEELEVAGHSWNNVSGSGAHRNRMLHEITIGFTVTGEFKALRLMMTCLLSS